MNASKATKNLSKDENVIKVLFVDDEPGFLELSKTYLEAIDPKLSVHPVNSVNQAFEVLSSNSYDVIISDYQMPEIDGMEFLESIRKSNKTIPFIVFTGRGREEVAIKALNFGANRYLQKGGDIQIQYELLVQAIQDEVKHNRDRMAKDKSEARYESILRVAPIGIGVVNEKREISFVSNNLCNLLGYSQKELIGKNARFIYPNDEEYSRVGIVKYAEIDKHGTGSIDTRWKRKDGTIIDVDLRSTPIDANDRSVGVTFTAMDISTRKKLESELRESEEKFSKAFKSTSSLLAISTVHNGRFIEANDSFMDILGYKRDELIGKTSSELNLFEEWKDREKAREKLMKDGAIRDIEIKMRTKSGKILWGSFSGTIINIQDKPDLLTMMIDKTDRKEAENREDFLYTLLKHDLRNKIHIIRGYLDLLLDSDLSQEQIKLIKRSLKANTESHQLTEKVEMLRTIEKEEIKKVYLDQFIEEAIEKNRLNAEEKNISIEFKKSSLEVLGGILLEELFHNLIENSINHSKCSIIKIKCKNTKEKVLIVVEDDGVGVPHEIRDILFEKGSQGKNSTGFGLGTYLIKNIVTTYQGGITYSDSDLGGARFDIWLNLT